MYSLLTKGGDGVSGGHDYYIWLITCLRILYHIIDGSGRIVLTWKVVQVGNYYKRKF